MFTGFVHSLVQYWLPGSSGFSSLHRRRRRRPEMRETLEGTLLEPKVLLFFLSSLSSQLFIAL